MPNNLAPIKDIESDLITALEFIRVAVKQFPVQTDKILNYMDISDDAFEEAYLALGDAVEFEFENEGADDKKD